MRKVYFIINFIKNNSYINSLLEKTLLLIPNIRFCPGKDCNFAIIADGFEKCPKLKCLNKDCGIFFCFNCKTKWHSNESCTQMILNKFDKNMQLWSSVNLKSIYQLHIDIINIFDIDYKVYLFFYLINIRIKTILLGNFKMN